MDYGQYGKNADAMALEKCIKIEFIITIFTYFCQETVEFYNIHILLYIFAII